MSAVKEATLSAHIAFSHQGAWIATGTVAGALDVNFSNSSKLEIYNTDLAGSTQQLQLTGSTAAPDRFHSLSWGSFGLADSSLPYGLIAGGLADGTVALWNPADVLSSPPTDGPLSPSSATAAPLAAMQNHAAAVRGLDFNRLSPNLLASGSAGGELLIWDLTTPNQPNVFPAIRTEQRAERRPGIAALAWNTGVQHILATASDQGSFSVWDVRKQKLTMDNVGADSGRLRRASAVAWNPAMSLQLVVASADDHSPTLQLWDLRHQQAPMVELLGHHRGIQSVAWSLHDPSILLSTGHDRRTILWDVPEGELRGELPLQSGPGISVRWSPSHPGLLATASLGAESGDQDGQVSLWTLASFAPGGGFDADGNVSGSARPLKQAPAWLRRPAGAAFGFGGRLASLSPRPDGAPSSVLSLQQVVTEAGLVEASASFEQALGSAEQENLLGLCDAKAAQMPGEDGETWAFLRIHLESDPRRHLLTQLGFADALEAAEQAPAAGDVASAAATLEAMDLGGGARTPRPTAGAPLGFDNDDAGAFFEDLQPASPAPATPASAKASQLGSPTHHHHHFAEPESGAQEGDIQRAIFVANYAGAVDLCLQAGRMADALLIASLGGQELWAKAQAAFMLKAPRPYMKIVAAVLKSDMPGLIKSRPLDEWKDTLAILASFSSGEEWGELCDQLARRLAAAGLKHAATLCWICAGKVDLTVKHWLSDVGEGKQLTTAELQGLMERAVMLGYGTNQQAASPALGDLLVSYSSLLAAQGQLTTAWGYLGMVPGEPPASVAELKDRVFRSIPPGLGLEGQNPPFPFIGQDVTPAPQVQPPQQQHAQQQYSQQQPHGQQYGQHQQQQYGGYGSSAQGYGGSAYQQPAQQSQGYSQNSGYGTYANPAPSNGNYAPSAGQGYGQSTTNPQGYGGQSTYGGATSQYAPPPAKAQPPVPAAQKWEPHQANKPTSPAAALPPKTSWGQQQLPHQQQQHQAPPPQQQQQQQPAWGLQQAQPQPQAYQPQQPAPYIPPPAAPAAIPSIAAPPPQAQQVSAGPVFEPRRRSTAGTAAFGAGAPPQGQAPAYAAPSQPTSPYGQAPGNPPFLPQGPAKPAAPPAKPVAPEPPAQPTGPPANVTIDTVDTSQVSQQHRPVVASIAALFEACKAVVASQPTRRREMDNNAQRLGVLFWHLNAHSLSPNVAEALRQICAALDGRDYATAGQLQANLTTTDWDECATWLTAIKRLVKLRATLP